MKKYCIELLTCLALVCAGCEQRNVPEGLTALDGLWGLTTDKTTTADGRYEEYVQFDKDMTFRYYYVTDEASVYHWGSYEILDGDVLMTYNGLRRFDIVDSIPRYTDDYYVENRPDKSMLQIIDYAQDKIVMKNSNGKCYFFRATKVYGWNDDFSAPAIPVTVDALLAQWDQLDFYQYYWQSTTWWYFYEPEKNGMILAADGAMTYCPFWENRVLEKMLNAGTLTSSEKAALDPIDCSWLLSADTLMMACSRLVAYTPDAQGNRTAEHTVTPEQPITIRFLVQRLTPTYLILYNPETQLFHAFCRHQEAAEAQKAVSSRTGKVLLHFIEGKSRATRGFIEVIR